MRKLAPILLVSMFVPWNVQPAGAAQGRQLRRGQGTKLHPTRSAADGERNQGHRPGNLANQAPARTRAAVRGARLRPQSQAGRQDPVRGHLRRSAGARRQGHTQRGHRVPDGQAGRTENGPPSVSAQRCFETGAGVPRIEFPWESLRPCRSRDQAVDAMDASDQGDGYCEFPCDRGVARLLRRPLAGGDGPPTRLRAGHGLLRRPGAGLQAGLEDGPSRRLRAQTGTAPSSSRTTGVPLVPGPGASAVQWITWNRTGQSTRSTSL